MVERNTQNKYIVIECNVEMVETNNRNAHKTKQNEHVKQSFD